MINSSHQSDKFITMDLETRTINEIMTPYAASIFDGTEKVSFYLEEFSNPNDLLTTALKYLMQAKYHNYKIYIHNFSFFDGVFLLRILSELSPLNIRPIIRDGRIIDLKFSFFIYKNKINLYFRYSYLLLPSSLSKLALNFGVENKGIFPSKFVNNPEISLNYDGPIPNIKYFYKLTEEEYRTYCSDSEILFKRRFKIFHVLLFVLVIFINLYMLYQRTQDTRHRTQETLLFIAI